MFPSHSHSGLNPSCISYFRFLHPSPYFRFLHPSPHFRFLHPSPHFRFLHPHLFSSPSRSLRYAAISSSSPSFVSMMCWSSRRIASISALSLATSSLISPFSASSSLSRSSFSRRRISNSRCRVADWKQMRTKSIYMNKSSVY